MNSPIEQWGVFEQEFEGAADGSTVLDVQFRFQHRIINITGFYDGGSVYRVRFMPDTRGEWQYTTRSSHAQLDGLSGQFICVEPSEGNHGPVAVRDTFHFAYADGTPYFPIGTTCYAWTHQSDTLQQQTLATLKQSPFNKLRMCVFPKHYTFNANEPELFPFERTTQGWDFSRFNPAFFHHLERRVADLCDLGIEADIILLHPYDRWGFPGMSDDEHEHYLRYVVTRLAGYRNVWWSLANEYDIYPKPLEIWDRFFRVVQESDPHQHLRSIHNWIHLEDHRWTTFYDHSKPWVTHCSIQHAHADLVPVWRDLYRKPIVLDEVCYEGDLPNGWGNITAEELTRRFWEGTVRGGYVGHGETYLDPNDVIWWSKGGVLHGESPARIAFLRQILEEGPAEGLSPVGEITNTHMGSGGKVGEYYLTYFGSRQPGQITFKLPDGVYACEVIDTWNMTITHQTELVTHGSTVQLPRKPYIAIRLRRTVQRSGSWRIKVG